MRICQINPRSAVLQMLFDLATLLPEQHGSVVVAAEVDQGESRAVRLLEVHVEPEMQ